MQTSEKKFENRSIFGKDMDKTLWLTFGGHPVYWFDGFNAQHRLLLLILLFHITG